MAQKRRTATALSVVIVLVCAFAVAAVAAFAATRPDPVDEGIAARIPPPAQYQYLRVSVLGDAVSLGVGASNLDGYVKLLSNKLCWNVNRVAESGTGYVNPGPDGSRPFTTPARLAATWGTGPELVIVQGSTNDVGRPGVAEAAAETYAAIKTGAPQAKIVVVGPTTPPSIDPAGVRATRDEIRDAAIAAGATFIDPIELGWLEDDGLYGTDRLHPTDAGHRELTKDLSTAFTGAGVLQRDTCAPTNR
ncbi:SGNH/GDSL hydrolase family protein [Rhodococcus sp. BP-316]|uniref:SGNH/GDSL hydrolase family protein n=1 Tax=Rhodococcus sp. BP-316 TaxID=2739445 RepID=UPI001C9AA9CD|nr:SGNH/GDSL hydrolase family protein [Rhodococcus sp. BP-316]MBY6681892.1 SGNH/GDSL hydrolase family protein [Rhodococcus sp. BP-316]